MAVDRNRAGGARGVRGQRLTMAQVRLEHLGKQYRGGITAVDDFNLTFDDGVFTCILGPSGSGKSTVLKLIAGIEDASAGRIFFDDRDVTEVTPERRDVAMVFQSYALYANMTARDNVAFPLMLRRVPRAERDRLVDEVAGMLGITGTLRRYPRQLSGGERQRVALARAIVRKPKVFLLDEPVSNLDPNLRVRAREELKRIHLALRATFIYVTHDQDDAEAMGERVVVMSDGRVQQYDSPSVVYHRPANRFVAGFLGRLPMNFVGGNIVDRDGRVRFESAGLELDLGYETETAAPRAGPVTLGVRPESVIATRSKGEGDGPVGTVTLTEIVAPDAYATVRIGEHSIRARIREDEELAVESRAALRFPLSRLHFFDNENGVRMADRHERPRLRVLEDAS
jgi:multiple sugar transport system ATP-binding protein